MQILGHVNRGERRVSAWEGNAVGLKLRPHPVALTLAMGQLKRFPEKLALLRSYAEELTARCGLRPQEVPERAERSYWRLVLHGPGDVQGLPAEPNHYWPPLQHQSLFDWPGNQVLRRECPVVREVAPNLVTLHLQGWNQKAAAKNA
jgi:hypothetical protein